MVIEGGCGPVKVRREEGGVGEEEGQKHRRQRELLERAGFHSVEKHVHFSPHPVSVNPEQRTVLITGFQ